MSKKKNFKYIYGPVSSWRLGRSLGVDAVYTGKRKVCSYDCAYCQAGKTSYYTVKRKVFIPTSKILGEIKSFPAIKLDYITLAGAGEPTLAKNLGNIIKGIKKMKKGKIAVLTNASLLDKEDVQKDLMKADYVSAKLDASLPSSFLHINRPVKGIELSAIIRGIKSFKKVFKGKFALQVMFTNKNKSCAEEIAGLVRQIGPDETELNTPLRPSGAGALSRKEMQELKKYFKGLRIKNVYEAKKKKIKAISKPDTIKRRGKP